MQSTRVRSDNDDLVNTGQYERKDDEGWDEEDVLGNESASESSDNEDDFPSARQAKRIDGRYRRLICGLADHMEAYQGYINESSEPILARINPSSIHNIVSIKVVVDRGLRFDHEWDSSEEAAELVLGHGSPQDILGVVKFVWKRFPGSTALDSSTKGSHISCFVCDSLPVPSGLILGKGYC